MTYERREQYVVLVERQHEVFIGTYLYTLLILCLCPISLCQKTCEADILRGVAGSTQDSGGCQEDMEINVKFLTFKVKSL